MNKWACKMSTALFGLALFGWLAACSASPQDSPSSADDSTLAPNAAQVGSAPTTQRAGSAGAAVSGADADAREAGAGPALGSAGGASSASVSSTVPTDSSCTTNLLVKKEGCACHAGDTAACWTGPVADRNVGACHDGLQICQTSGEFSTWGPCMGEQRSCGTDAGVPPPPPSTDCSCIPGAVIQCSEDCSVNIICSLTATKTCLPDGTWSVCREDMGVQLDVPGVQCRNMLHGCLDLLNPDMPAKNELYVGDCSKQFKCGHSPPPPDSPPGNDTTD